MNKKNLLKLIGRAQESVTESVEQYVAASGKTLDGAKENSITVEDAKSEMEGVSEYFNILLNGKTNEGQRVERNLQGKNIDFTEAFQSADAGVILHRLLRKGLVEPEMPANILYNMFERIEVPHDHASSVEWPVMDSIRAYDMGSSSDYRVDNADFKEMSYKIDIGKIGCLAYISEEAQKRSQWNLLGLLTRHQGYAIQRRKEEHLYEGMVSNAKVVIDNESLNTGMHSQGTANDQTPNGTFSYFDMLKMYSILLNKDKIGTDIFMSPVAWPILAQDPLFMGSNMLGGSLGGNRYTATPQQDQQMHTLWNLNYIPYYAIEPEENYTLAGPLSGLQAGVVTDIYMIDRNKSLMSFVQGPEAEFDKFDEFLRDATALKARAFYAAAVKDDGNGMVKATKIRIARNRETLANFGSHQI